MPGDFQVRFPKAHDAYIVAPTLGHPRAGSARRAYTHTVFARLQPERSIAAARGAMRQLGETLRREYPTTPQNTTVEVILVDEYFFGRTRPLLIALAGAAAFIRMVTRSIRTFMFGVAPNDPVVVLTSVALLALVLLVSCFVPLRRALAIEPAEALRRE
jgi:hypothetical protein